MTVPFILFLITADLFAACRSYKQYRIIQSAGQVEQQRVEKELNEPIQSDDLLSSEVFALKGDKNWIRIGVLPVGKSFHGRSSAVSVQLMAKCMVTVLWGNDEIESLKSQFK